MWWRKLEELLFGDRWKNDEYAWRFWQSAIEYQPQIDPSLWRPGLICGFVSRINERARDGTKAMVDFGPSVGVRDTWWPRRVPPQMHFVFVEAHLWPGPGTHSGGPVIWIDRWDSTAPKDMIKRAKRHELRMAKLAAAEAKAVA
jgi:hypothetical protein